MAWTPRASVPVTSMRSVSGTRNQERPVAMVTPMSVEPIPVAKHPRAP